MANRVDPNLTAPKDFFLIYETFLLIQGNPHKIFEKKRVGSEK